MSRLLLEVKGLNIHFKTEAGLFHAVKDVDFQVQRGGITAVVGESGSGKSVTSLAILRLLAPNAIYSSGSICFYEDDKPGMQLLHQHDDEMRRIRGNSISMIFQEPMTSLNPLMRCGNQVAEALMLHQHINRAQALEKTLQLFNRVKLPDAKGMIRRYPHQLSGGQKQRVMIALAMSCGPSLLIADEPTTALDVTVQKTILELIRELQKESDMGVIFISHDLGLVSEIADQIVVMYQGAVVEQGTVDQILKTPAHPYTKALLACRPILHQKGIRLPMVSDFITVQDETQEKTPPFSPNTTNSNVSSNNLLEVKDLNVWFPSKKNFLGKTLDYVKAVNGVSFEVKEGETLGLVGESGCGKTTLGRALLRLINPTSGQILYKGRDLASWSASELKPFRKDIQIIFQDPYSSLNPRLSVGNALSEVMLVHGIGSGDRERKDLAVQWLEKVGLASVHYSRYPHEFSGGQRQRIGIARALALHPGFVVCDESVSALDVSVQAQVLNLLNDLKREIGFTTVFISHDLGVVHYLSDRIMVMNQGKIEEIGQAGDIFTNPTREYTQKLLEAIPGRIFNGF